MKGNIVNTFRALLLGVLFASAGCGTDLSGPDSTPSTDDHTPSSNTGTPSGSSGDHGGSGAQTGSNHDPGTGDGSDDTDPDSGSGGAGTNLCKITVNNHTIECVDGACICSVNGQEVSRCNDDPETQCSVPGDCCGF